MVQEKYFYALKNKNRQYSHFDYTAGLVHSTRFA